MVKKNLLESNVKSKQRFSRKYFVCFWLFHNAHVGQVQDVYQLQWTQSDRLSMIWTISFPRFVALCCFWSFVDDFWLHLMEERGSIDNLGFYNAAYQSPT